MKIKWLFIFCSVCLVSLLSSCSSLPSPLSSKNTPELFPIRQNDKFGYINRKGEVVIQPQFAQAWFFSEGLAAVCIGQNKCGYIDNTGKFIVNPQFTLALRFSEGLAAVAVENKIGYIDKTGKFAINPQFGIGSSPGSDIYSIAFNSFSEGLASVKVGDKYGFIDKEGKIIINPQFEFALPFFDGLASVQMGNKWGFVNKEGKIIINPQFEQAEPFSSGLAVVKINNQYGYIDKTGKIVINPQFDNARSFSDEGLAMISVGKKAGFIDKDGKYVINPQFEPNFHPSELFEAFITSSNLGQISFSEGLASILVGKDKGYIDKTGKIVINPQFYAAFPFYGGLAKVFLSNDEHLVMAYIDKEGKYVWRETRETPKSQNSNSAVSNTASNSADSTTSNTSSPTSEQKGRLTTDSNLRSDANKDAASLGIHFKGAKIKILEEKNFIRDGENVTWYKVKITEYGCSVDANLGCGKNSPNDADEGWVNSKNILLD